MSERTDRGSAVRRVASVRRRRYLFGVLRSLFACVLIVGVLAVAATAGASGRVRATFTRTIPSYKGAGEHVVIGWKLRDSAGHPVSLRRVFVRIVCPEGDASTIAYAKAIAPGLYRANAIVPPGGIGTVTLGAKGSRIRITNPFRRQALTNLGTLPGGNESVALALNENNHIIGWSTNRAGQRRAVLWTLRPVSK